MQAISQEPSRPGRHFLQRQKMLLHFSPKIPILGNAPIAEPINNAIHYTVKFYIEAVKPGT